MATAVAVPAASSPPRAVTTLKARKEIVEFARGRDNVVRW